MELLGIGPIHVALLSHNRVFISSEVDAQKECHFLHVLEVPDLRGPRENSFEGRSDAGNHIQAAALYKKKFIHNKAAKFDHFERRALHSFPVTQCLTIIHCGYHSLLNEIRGPIGHHMPPVFLLTPLSKPFPCLIFCRFGEIDLDFSAFLFQLWKFSS